MQSSNNRGLLQSFKKGFDYIWKGHQKDPARVLTIVSHHNNNWALNAVHGTQTYFANSQIPLEEQPHLDVVYAQILDGDLLDETTAHLERIIKKYHAVVTVGLSASIAIKSWMVHNRIEKPLFACGVKDPVAAGLVSSTEGNRPENIGVVTGVGHNHERQVQTFLSVKPDTRRVALAHYNIPLSKFDTGNDVAAMKKAFENRGITVTLKELSTQSDLFATQVMQLAQDVDAITLFRDIQLYNNVNSIIDVCNKTDTTLFTSELASLFAGAGVGFGDTGFEYGERLGVLLEDYLFRSICPGSMPVAWIHEPGMLRVNAQVIGRQGLHLDARAVDLIGHAILVNGI